MAKSFATEWAFDEFAHELSFVARNMFGCRAAYLDGKLVLVLAEDREDPKWCGALVPVEWDAHESVKKDFPSLNEHPILGKWLYLPANSEEFDSDLEKISRLIARRDPRMGVIPKERKSRSKTKLKRQGRKKR